MLLEAVCATETADAWVLKAVGATETAEVFASSGKLVPEAQERRGGSAAGARKETRGSRRRLAGLAE